MDNVSRETGSATSGNAWTAFQRVWPAALAVVPVSMLFGVLAIQAHWNILDVLVVSLLGFTGSGQFALLPLASQGVGFFTMLLLAVSINCRYVPIAFVGASRLPQRFWPRFWLAHMLGDEAYATEKEGDPVQNILVIRLTIFTVWIVSAAAGAMIARLIPSGLIDSTINLGFPASMVLLYLSFGQLRARFADMSRARRRHAAGLVLCIMVATGAVALLGPNYFWIPSITLCTWIIWRAQA